jgi:hypothetical protein
VKRKSFLMMKGAREVMHTRLDICEHCKRVWFGQLMKQSIVFHGTWNRRWYLIPSHCPVHTAIAGTVLGIDDRITSHQ